MSIKVSALARRFKTGSPTRKSVLLMLADFASDNGAGIWASKATMAEELEMSRRTVQLAIADLKKMGVVVEVGTRPCAHGFTIEYYIDIEHLREQSDRQN